jgi:hypothetical protein
MAVRTNIEAPPARPPAYGLIAAATALDSADFDWTVEGFQFVPEGCGDGGIAGIDCNGGSTGTIDPDFTPTTIEGDPVYLWAGDNCRTTFGYLGWDRAGRARRQLAATESFRLAAELWDGAVGASLSHDNRHLIDSASDTITNGPESLRFALACLDGYVGVPSDGQRGMLHMTPQLLAHAAHMELVERQGNLWVTPMGNVVVADYGYSGNGPGGDPAGDSQWVYATSTIRLLLGPVEVVGADPVEGVDRSTNTWKVFAGRAASWQWDECVHLAAEVDIARCLVGGAS